MTITVTWLDDSQQAIIMHFEGAWTWDEYLTALGRVTAMTTQTSQPVAHISDFTHSSGLPQHAIGRLRELSSEIAQRRDHTKLSIIVGADQVIMKLVQVFAHLYNELAYFDTLAEARAFLRQRQSNTA